MPRANLILTNFTTGEVSPSMVGRVDTTKYANGAAQIKNFIVRQQGGLFRRQGSQYLGDVDTGHSDKTVLLHEFIFSVDQQYVIEFGHLYFRVWTNLGLIVDTTPIYPLQEVPLRVVTPYSGSELSGLRFVQSADIMYVTHPDHQPMKLERFGEFDWRIVALNNQDGPYVSFNDTGATLQVYNVYNKARATSTKNIFTSISPTKAITAVTKVSGVDLTIKITSIAHGFTTGDSVIIADLTVTKSGVLQTGGADAPHGNGTYTVTVIDANHFTLDGSTFAVFYNSSDATTTDGVYVFASATARAAVNANSYVEYRYQNEYRLAYIWTYLTTKTADVYIDLYLKLDVASNVVLYFNSADSSINATYGGVFTNDDVGKYVRLTNGEWYLISSYTSDSKVIGGHVLKVSTANGAVVTISNNRRTAYVASDIDVFATTDMGRHIRMNFNGSQTWGIITAVYGTKYVSIDLKERMPFSTSQGNYAYFEYGGTTFLWKFGAWSDTTGFPRTVVLHEERLTFMGTYFEPQSVWMSKSADYENFAPTELDSTVLDSSAVTYTLTSTKSNPIVWSISGTYLLIGTTGGEYVVKSSTITQPITPTNLGIYPQTNYGSNADCTPFRVGYATLFVQKSAMKIMELYYDFTIDSYVGKNCNVVNDHVLRQGGGAIRTAFVQEPHSIVWALLADGTLAAMTYERNESVYAWHRHTLGGDARVESICAIRSYRGGEDRLWMLVSRTLNGTVVKSIEFMGQDFYPSNSQDKNRLTIDGPYSISQAYDGNDGFGVPAGNYLHIVIQGYNPDLHPENIHTYVITTGIQVTGMPGLFYGNGTYRIIGSILDEGLGLRPYRLEINKPYFAGTYIVTNAKAYFFTSEIPMAYMDRWTAVDAQQVVSRIVNVDTRYNGIAMQVVVDGAALPGLITVVAGTITLPTQPLYTVLYGFAFQSLFEALPLEGGSPFGTSQGKIKRVDTLDGKFYNSIGFKTGSDLTKMVYQSFRDSADVMDSSPPFFTGDRRVQLPQEYNQTGKFYITQDEPYPLNILALMPDMNTYE